jgi:hypothetical protein
MPSEKIDPLDLNITIKKALFPNFNVAMIIGSISWLSVGLLGSYASKGTLGHFLSMNGLIMISFLIVAGGSTTSGLARILFIKFGYLSLDRDKKTLSLKSTAGLQTIDFKKPFNYSIWYNTFYSFYEVSVYLEQDGHLISYLYYEFSPQEVKNLPHEKSQSKFRVGKTGKKLKEYIESVV